MNNIILRGRLTTDAEVRITTEDKPTTVARFSLAVQDRTHRNSNGDYDVDFIKCVAFNGIANNIEQYTSKGSEILIVGRLHTYSYKNKEDKNIYITEVIIEKLEFVMNCKKADIEVPDTNEDLPFH